MSKKSEILAPVASLEMCQAAIHNGANAIYIGAPGYNARGRTQDFTIADLAEIIELCHDYDVKVYIALNILIFENELKNLTTYLAQLMRLKPDAFIIQDIGLINCIKMINPQQDVHASTQMTISSAHAIKLTEDLDISRYVLARELSLEDIELIKSETNKELEVFIHGALCVSYSGQCLTSESFGGRSANRGQCAQSCRLDYKLFVNGVEKDLKGRNYLFSPKDLCARENVLKLQEIGVESLKIEGRLKTPQYVASVTKMYREILDNKNLSIQNLEKLKNDSALQYSRGFYTGWLKGTNHQKLVDGYSNEHRGLFVGYVTNVKNSHRGYIEIESASYKLKAGDGLLFTQNNPRQEYGGRIYKVDSSKSSKLKLFFNNEFPYAKVLTGFEVYHNDSPDIEKKLKRSWTDKERWKTLAIKAKLSGKVEEFLELELSYKSFTAKVKSQNKLTTANNRGLEKVMAYKTLASLRESPFSLDENDFDFKVKGLVFVNNKELRNLKQLAVAKLLELRRNTNTVVIREFDFGKKHKHIDHNNQNKVCLNKNTNTPKLNLLVRESAQLDMLEGLPLDTVYMDYEWGQRYRQGIEQIREMGFKAGMTSLRIHKPKDDYLIKMIANLKPDVLLARNLSAIQMLKDQNEIELIGDHSLNICNSLSAQWFLKHNLKRFTPSYDLNQIQLNQLIEALNPSMKAQTEVVIHHYMPAFHMEHCVFAAFLSKGTGYPSCGKICTKNKVEIRDHKGEQHYLKSDQNCRNTMYRGSPQSAAKLIPELIKQDISNFRIELLWEKPDEIARKVNLYHDVLTNKKDPENIIKALNVEEKYGVTVGQLFNTSTYNDRKKTN